MGASQYVLDLRERLGTQLLLLPSVCGLVFNDAGEILLHRRSDTGRWAVIGGGMDPGEQPADAVVRKVFEETGVRAVAERITAVYTVPQQTYANGDQAQYVVTVFRCRWIAGTPHAADDETLEAKFFPLDQLPELRPDHRARIEHAAAGGEPFFVPPDKPVT